MIFNLVGMREIDVTITEDGLFVRAVPEAHMVDAFPFNCFLPNGAPNYEDAVNELRAAGHLPAS